MPCCGLIAFLLGQPVLLWRGIRSWLGGGSFAAALRMDQPITIKAAGAFVAAELLLFALGAAITAEARPLDSRLTEAAFLPLGRICSIFSHGT